MSRSSGAVRLKANLGHAVCHGHSIAAGSFASGLVTNNQYGQLGYFERLCDMLGVPVGLQRANRAVGGSVAAFDSASDHPGGYSDQITDAIWTRWNKMYPYDPGTAFSVLHYGINDAIMGSQAFANGTHFQTQYINAMRLMITHARAGAVLGMTGNAAWTLGGPAGTNNWAQQNLATKGNVQNAQRTTTNGDAIRFTVPADYVGKDVTLFGIVDTVVAPTHTLNFHVNGVDDGAPVSAAALYIPAAGANYGAHATPWVKRFTNLNPGDTVDIIVGGLTAGDYAYVQGALLAAPIKPIVLVPGFNYQTDAAGAFGSPSLAQYRADLDAMDTALKALIGEFDSRVIYGDSFGPFGGQGNSPAVALYSSDGLHPNDQGHALLAESYYKAILPARMSITDDEISRMNGQPAKRLRWQPLTLGTNVIPYAGFSPLGAAFQENGMVKLRGVLEANAALAANATLATLPQPGPTGGPSLLPSYTQLLIPASSIVGTWLNINSAGVINFAAALASGQFVSLDGLEFPVYA